MSTEYGFITSGLGLKVYITPFTGLIATTISTFYFSSRRQIGRTIIKQQYIFCFAADKQFLSVVN